MLVFDLDFSLAVLVSNRPGLLIESLDFLLDYSDVLSLCLLLLRCVQNCLLATVNFFELHVLIKQLLELAILFFGHVF